MTARSFRGGVAPLPSSPTIHLGSRHGVGAGMRLHSTASGPASGANPFAVNDMLAFPFMLSAPSTSINKAFWVNGTAAGGNSSVAIYDADFVMLAQSASTGGSGASVPQSVACTAKLGPGTYYCALAHDSTTSGRFFRWTVATTGAGFWMLAGCWKQSSVTVGALPNPATPVACTDVGFPLFGLITRTVFDV